MVSFTLIGTSGPAATEPLLLLMLMSVSTCVTASAAIGAAATDAVVSDASAAVLLAGEYLGIVMGTRNGDLLPS